MNIPPDHPETTDSYAEQLLSTGQLRDICHGDLCDALEWAWREYLVGTEITQNILEQRRTRDRLRQRGFRQAAALLAAQKKGRPMMRGDYAFIRVMLGLYVDHSPNRFSLRSYYHYGDGGGKHGGPFMSFCEAWLSKIDPTRKKPPSHHIYERAWRDASSNNKNSPAIKRHYR